MEATVEKTATAAETIREIFRELAHCDFADKELGRLQLGQAGQISRFKREVILRVRDGHTFWSWAVPSDVKVKMTLDQFIELFEEKVKSGGKPTTP